MNNQQAYDVWADNYDTVPNKTRDLEALALRKSIVNVTEPLDILEIGCGTGKNTEWLLTKAKSLIGVDFSAEMLIKAKEKITAKTVQFRHFDLRNEWEFEARQFDVITCSLTLEHLENLDFVFRQAHKILRENGLFYIGELHPFKQYQGSKARFETEAGIFELECFVHNISDYFAAARNNNFKCIDLREWFDNNNNTVIPRLLTLVFQTKK